MARLTAAFADERAAFWAAVAFNLSPVFGVSSGGWVLPDGPLDAALLGAALCLVHALRSGAWRWWVGVGLCFGLAMMAKYTAALTGFGLVLFLIATPGQRHWFARPQLYVAGLLASLVFAPVVVWNAQNGFASLAFQSGRAAAAALHPFGPVVVLAGEAAFLLPWIWAGLLAAGLHGFRAHIVAPRLLAFLAAPPIVVFCVVALWSRQVLFHWAAPGYLMLYPLLGIYLAPKIWAPRAARATAGLLACVAVVVIALVHLPVALPKDPLLQARTWAELGPAVADSALPVAATSWADVGKLGIALGPERAVYCLSSDERQFHFRPHPALGSDLLIVAPRSTLAQIQARYAGNFESVTELRHVTVSATDFTVFVAHGLKAWPG
jgi:4-amino-4-deoxy-L-arabinose transferase-like glycosyltransferase